MRTLLVLVVLEGPSAGLELPLDQSFELGCDPGLEHPLADEEVARRHARVDVRGDEVIVSDLGSPNGTYVNDQPITHERRLVAGDRLRLGLTVLGVHESAAATDTPRRPDLAPGAADVLQPVAVDELPAPDQPSSDLAGFAAEEVEPAFVPEAVVEAAVAPTARGPLARLVDAQVKHRATIAATSLLATSGLSVIAYYVLR